jgi:hypothetical protein
MTNVFLENQNEEISSFDLFENYYHKNIIIAIEYSKDKCPSDINSCSPKNTSSSFELTIHSIQKCKHFHEFAISNF